MVFVYTNQFKVFCCPEFPTLKSPIERKKYFLCATNPGDQQPMFFPCYLLSTNAFFLFCLCTLDLSPFYAKFPWLGCLFLAGEFMHALDYSLCLLCRVLLCSSETSPAGFHYCLWCSQHGFSCNFSKFMISRPHACAHQLKGTLHFPAQLP